MRLAVVALTALLAACTPVHAEQPTLYLEAAIGVDQLKDGSGFLGHRTMGHIALGIEYDQLFIEVEHLSNVQTEDEHGGYNVLWLGFRKEWGL